MNKLTYQNSVLRIVTDKINISNYYYFLITIIVLFILLINTPYKTSYEYVLIKDDSYKLIVDDTFFSFKNKYLYFNHKKYAYSVVEISDNYITNDKRYYNVIIDIDISDFKSNKNIFTVEVIKDKSTLLKYFLNKMKGK